MTTIVQLGAGALMVHSIDRLRAAGYRVHALDRNAQAPGLVAADAGAPIDFADIDAVTAYARDVAADLVLGINEPGVWTAAVTSARLGLANVPPAVAWSCLHKGRMRSLWQEAGLRQPSFAVARDVAAVRAAVDRLGYPLVLKPTLGWGSSGVSAIHDADDLEPALRFAAANVGSFAAAESLDAGSVRPEDACPFIVERFVEGLEVTIEGLVRDGALSVLGISDKAHQAHRRYRVAMALHYPAALDTATEMAVVETVSAAARALGLRTGAVHAECLIDAAGDVHLVELGARGGGGHIFGLVVEGTSGVCMPVALAKLFLGETVDIDARYRRGACYRFFAPPPGRFLGIEGLEAARDLPGVETIGFSLAPGTQFDAVATDASRPGFLVTTGVDRGAAATRADEALASLRFQVEERPSAGDRDARG